MKTKSYLLLAAVFAAVAWTLPTTIRWTWNDANILHLNAPDGKTLELGLRSDGVVVWREISHTTNSPAEDGFNYFTTTNNLFNGPNIILTPAQTPVVTPN